MKNSISKLVGFRQSSFMVLRTRERGRNYLVVAYFKDGSYTCLGTITSNRHPTNLQIQRLLDSLPPEHVEVEKIVVLRKDCYRFASEYVRSF